MQGNGKWSPWIRYFDSNPICWLTCSHQSFNNCSAVCTTESWVRRFAMRKIKKTTWGAISWVVSGVRKAGTSRNYTSMLSLKMSTFLCNIHWGQTGKNGADDCSLNLLLCVTDLASRSNSDSLATAISKRKHSIPKYDHHTIASMEPNWNNQTKVQKSHGNLKPDHPVGHYSL